MGVWPFRIASVRVVSALTGGSRVPPLRNDAATACHSERRQRMSGHHGGDIRGGQGAVDETRMRAVPTGAAFFASKGGLSVMQSVAKHPLLR